MAEFLKLYQQTSNLAGMTYLRPFVAHGVALATEEQIEANVPKMLTHVTDPNLVPR
ncbi:hypothetical protein [Ruegeria arenilitoris]|uniref:hypothetical protein n=1 Tax=Ruegeria arenilitoris TaxID=1173585 RepID=UPI001481193D|nr:hypothetical protein [Ruegeria arenilitoris]